jgi:ABC-type antimicrobial peptide transport system permease subunit
VKIYWKIIKQSIRLSIEEIISSKLRSFLSLLGVAIGVLCVVAISTAVTSLEKNIENSFSSFGTDILYGNDFFSYEPNEWDILITNPPFSIKDKWIKRCYDLDKPWILLLPLTALEGQFRQKLYREKGVNIMFFDKRINYINDNAKTGSPFASVILSWKVDIGGQFIFI